MKQSDAMDLLVSLDPRLAGAHLNINYGGARRTASTRRLGWAQGIMATRTIELTLNMGSIENWIRDHGSGDIAAQADRTLRHEAAHCSTYLDAWAHCDKMDSSWGAMTLYHQLRKQPEWKAHGRHWKVLAHKYGLENPRAMTKAPAGSHPRVLDLSREEPTRQSAWFRDGTTLTRRSTAPVAKPVLCADCYTLPSLTGDCLC